MPSLELLEQTHDFPCRFMFKAIGKVDDGFVARVIIAVRETLELDVDPPFSLRQTPAGRHVAVTLEPYVQTSDQVLAVYERVRTLAGLVMLC